MLTAREKYMIFVGVVAALGIWSFVSGISGEQRDCVYYSSRADGC